MRLAGALVFLMSLHAVAEAQYAQPPPPPPPGYGPPGYGPPPPGYYGNPPPPPAPVGVVRDGFTIGLGLGLGSISSDCEDCDSEEGIALDFHLGVMITPRVAILLEVGTVTKSSDDPDLGEYSISHDIAAIALRFFAADRFWIEGGLGVGNLVYESNFERFESDAGGAFVAAAGFELLQRESFTFDLQGRIAVVGYDDGDGDTERLTNLSILLGINWY